LFKRAHVGSLLKYSRHFPFPRAQVLGPLSAPVTDPETSNRALVPVRDVAQDRFQIISDRRAIQKTVALGRIEVAFYAMTQKICTYCDEPVTTWGRIPPNSSSPNRFLRT
jgi:hypothetical protein